MIALIAASFVSCSTPAPAEEEIMWQERWHLFVPEGGPSGALPVEMTVYADPKIAQKLSVAAQDWELHLSCGVRLRMIDSRADADIKVLCADLPVFKKEGSFIAWGVEDSKRVGVIATRVVLSSSACEKGQSDTMRTALAYGLGFPQTDTWPVNMTSGVQASLELEGHGGHGFTNFETDGWRVWALERGAPGCGEKELQWTWISDPKSYDGPPPPEVVQELTALSAQNQ